VSNRLTGKVCIITGAGGSMGREAALTFAREGALVVACDLHADDAEATVRAVHAAGGTMLSLHPCDLTKPSECRALVDLAVRTFGRIDVLFNNAPMAYFNWLEDITDEEWDRNRREEGSGVFPHASCVAAFEGEPRRGREHGVPDRPDELQEPRLARPHHGQGRDYRHDVPASDGRAEPWDPRQLDFTRRDRNQPDASAAERSGMGRLNAWQDAVKSSRPARVSGEGRAVPGL
jgi:hypothetical protein